MTFEFDRPGFHKGESEGKWIDERLFGLGGGQRRHQGEQGERGESFAPDHVGDGII
jgi:hypothetical protein